MIAKGKVSAHRQGQEPSEIPEVSADFCYYAKKSDVMPVTSIKERNKGMFAATALPPK